MIENIDQEKQYLTINKPWGNYTVLLDDKNYKVKRIIVLPNKRLSLQSHKKRCENWVIVQGKAKVTLENDELILTPRFK